MKTEAKPRHGGARVGAGRKPKLQHEARAMFYQAVDARWETIIAQLDELIAKGDKQTLRWVLEQRIGRAPQCIEVKGSVETREGESMVPAGIIQLAEELLRFKMLRGIASEEAIPQLRELLRES